MIREGQERKHFLSTRNSRELAQIGLQQMVGAQLMSRMTGDLSWFYRGSDELLKSIRGEQAAPLKFAHAAASAPSTLSN
jgi:hypothetical protein